MARTVVGAMASFALVVSVYEANCYGKSIKPFLRCAKVKLGADCHLGWFRKQLANAAALLDSLPLDRLNRSERDLYQVRADRCCPKVGRCRG